MKEQLNELQNFFRQSLQPCHDENNTGKETVSEKDREINSLEAVSENDHAINSIQNRDYKDSVNNHHLLIL